MAFNSEMWRTEELHRFRDKGCLSAHGQVVVGNAGLAARYNPIPSILEHLVARPCSQNATLARFNLATHFVKIGLCQNKDSVDVANDVIAWFLDPHCHACHGTGVKNKEQETCPVCGGSPKYPTWELARKGCNEIESLFMWREVQLRKRMKGSDERHYPVKWDGESSHNLTLTPYDGGVSGRTPPCPTADEQS